MCSFLWYFEVVFTIVSYGILLYVIPLGLLFPLYLVHKGSWYWIEKRLYNWLAYIFLNYPSRRRYHVRAYGDYEKLRDIVKNRKDDLALVIANHQTPVDIMVLINFWTSIVPTENHFLDLSWIQDYLLGVIPTGWVSKIHGDFFVLQAQDVNGITKCTQCTSDSHKIRSRLERNLRSYVKTIVNRHRFIQFFPEAGLFENTKQPSQRFAKRHSLPVLDYVALPKCGGIACIVDELGKNDRLSAPGKAGRNVKHLVCLTINYPEKEKPWSVAELLTSTIFTKKQKYCYVHVHVEDVTNIPMPKIDDPESLQVLSSDDAKAALGAKMKEPFEQYIIRKYQEMEMIQRGFYSMDEIFTTSATEELAMDERASLSKSCSGVPDDFVELGVSTWLMVLNYILGVLCLGSWVGGIVLLCIYV